MKLFLVQFSDKNNFWWTKI